MTITRPSSLYNETDTKEKPAHKSLIEQNKSKEKSYSVNSGLHQNVREIVSEEDFLTRHCRVNADFIMRHTMAWNMRKTKQEQNKIK